jgi:hypothetical protein
MEAVSAEKLAKEVAEKIQIISDYVAISLYTDDEYDDTDPHEVLARKLIEEYEEYRWRHPDNDYTEMLVAQAINKATEVKDRELEREREEKEKLCKRIEFTHTFMKTRIEDSLTLRALLKDNQDLIDQIRLER